MSMRDQLAAGSLGKRSIQVEGARLLAVCVTVHAALDAAEHARQCSAVLGAVTDPAILERLLDLPALIPVPHSATWAELSDQPPAVARRADDGQTVTRLLRPPLAIHQVVVSASAEQELAAMHDVSLFAGFARRWIAVAADTTDSVPEAVTLEAALCGASLGKRPRACPAASLQAAVPAPRTRRGRNGGRRPTVPSLPAVARALATGIARPELAPVIDKHLRLLFRQTER